MASPYLSTRSTSIPCATISTALVDFDRLRVTDELKLFVAATNVRTGRGEIFRRTF